MCQVGARDDASKIVPSKLMLTSIVGRERRIFDVLPSFWRSTQSSVDGVDHRQPSNGQSHPVPRRVL